MDELEMDILLLEMEANGLIIVGRDEEGRLTVTVTDAGLDRLDEIDELLPPCTCDDCEDDDE